MTTGGNVPDLRTIRRLRGRRPVEALVLAGDHNATLSAADAARQRNGLWLIQEALNWQPPFYRLDIHALPWPKTRWRKTFTAALSQAPFTAQTLETTLSELALMLIPHSMAQLNMDMRHHFWLSLSSVLRHGGSARLRAFFEAFFQDGKNFALHGVVLTPPEMPASSCESDTTPSAVWSGIAGHSRNLRGRVAGVDPWRIVRLGGMSILLLWGAGMLLSAVTNALKVRQVHELVAQVDSAPSVSLLIPLQTTITEMSHGTPWYRRFGLDITHRILPALTPAWVRLSRREIISPMKAALEASLATTSGNITEDYNRLKTYLMLANPTWMNDAGAQTFLVEQLSVQLPQIPLPSLVYFSRQFATHPELSMTPEAGQVAQSRQRLLRALSDPQTETRFYRQMINDAGRNYAGLTLAQLTDGTDTSGLFTLDAIVPGAFTREAYNNVIRPQIMALASTRREQISRVLADPAHPVDRALSPEGLHARLMERYLTEYAAAWQSVLNRIKPASSSEPLQQLTRLTDKNNSPLVALMQQLSWQGLTASPDEQHAVVNSLLAPVFGGIVSMASPASTIRDGGISLDAWLRQMTRLRDRIRSHSANTAALATSVFSGTQVDNRDPNLSARVDTQFGIALRPMANALFVAPSGQTWKSVMQRGITQINTQWRQEIVAGWRQRFEGKYPFSDSRVDCNMAELGDFIRPASGQMATFIAEHLRGVLVYRNRRWHVADKLPPGLAVNPDFLVALNQLNQVGASLFDNHFGVRFRLQPGVARDVVQTELHIDGQQLLYFNQMPGWVDVQWPDNMTSPGATLIWSSVRAGTRIYSDQPGRWGFIRLLAQAKRAPVDNHHTRLTWLAQDGLQLNYLLETNPEHNPLTVLMLKGFQLPELIFVTSR